MTQSNDPLRDNLVDLLQDLHDSQITGGIGWLFDGCWPLNIGQASNRRETVLETLEDAIEWLRANAVQLYPDSEFAKKYRRGFE